MPRELKFDDAKIRATEEAKRIPNVGEVKAFIERVQRIEKEMGELSIDRASVYKEAKDAGIDTQAMKIVVKHRKAPMDTDRMDEVNDMLEKIGDLPLFHVPQVP